MNSLSHGNRSREEEESQRAHRSLENAAHLISRLLPKNDGSAFAPGQKFP
jgi:hypothetical protein